MFTVTVLFKVNEAVATLRLFSGDFFKTSHDLMTSQDLACVIGGCSYHQET